MTDPANGLEVSPWLITFTQAVVTLLVGAVSWYLASHRRKSVRQGREEAMFESLQLANRTLPYLRRGLDAETATRTAHLIYDYFQPGAVSVVSHDRVLAFVGAGSDHHQIGTRPSTRLAREALRTGRPMIGRTWAELGCPRSDCPLHACVAAPLKTRDRIIGVLKVYYGVDDPLTTGRVRVVTALAQLMSIQVELAELDRKTEQLAKAELAALQAQISPHFVYNTLNTIAAFIRTKPDEARRLLVDFADFTRRSFKRRGEFAPFAQELEYVHQYLGFEKARFGDRLQVVYQVDPEILTTVVPVLVLQPLVENAVRHGVAHKEGPVRVVIRAEDRGNECWITVQDDGIGIPPEVALRLAGAPPARPDGVRRRNGTASESAPGPALPPPPTHAQGGGLGLANVHERLRSVYGPEYGLRIQGGPGEGTRISFVVPKYSTRVQTAV